MKGQQEHNVASSGGSNTSGGSPSSQNMRKEAVSSFLTRPPQLKRDFDQYEENVKLDYVDEVLYQQSRHTPSSWLARIQQQKGTSAAAASTTSSPVPGRQREEEDHQHYQQRAESASPSSPTHHSGGRVSATLEWNAAASQVGYFRPCFTKSVAKPPSSSSSAAPGSTNTSRKSPPLLEGTTTASAFGGSILSKSDANKLKGDLLLTGGGGGGLQAGGTHRSTTSILNTTNVSSSSPLHNGASLLGGTNDSSSRGVVRSAAVEGGAAAAHSSNKSGGGGGGGGGGIRRVSLNSTPNSAVNKEAVDAAAAAARNIKLSEHSTAGNDKKDMGSVVLSDTQRSLTLLPPLGGSTSSSPYSHCNRRKDGTTTGGTPHSSSSHLLASPLMASIRQHQSSRGGTGAACLKSNNNMGSPPSGPDEARGKGGDGIVGGEAIMTTTKPQLLPVAFKAPDVSAMDPFTHMELRVVECISNLRETPERFVEDILERSFISIPMPPWRRTTTTGTKEESHQNDVGVVDEAAVTAPLPSHRSVISNNTTTPSIAGGSNTGWSNLLEPYLNLASPKSFFSPLLSTATSSAAATGGATTTDDPSSQQQTEQLTLGAAYRYLRHLQDQVDRVTNGSGPLNISMDTAEVASAMGDPAEFMAMAGSSSPQALQGNNNNPAAGGGGGGRHSTKKGGKGGAKEDPLSITRKNAADLLVRQQEQCVAQVRAYIDILDKQVVAPFQAYEHFLATHHHNKTATTSPSTSGSCSSIPRAEYNRGLSLTARGMSFALGCGKPRLSTHDALSQYGQLTGEVSEYIVYGVKDPEEIASEVLFEAMQRDQGKILMYPTKLYVGVGWQRHTTRGAVTVIVLCTGFQEISYIKKHSNLPIVELKRCMALGQMTADERLYDLNFIPEHYGIKAVHPKAHPVVCSAIVELLVDLPPTVTLACTLQDSSCSSAECGKEQQQQHHPSSGQYVTYIDRVGRKGKISAVLPQCCPTRVVVYARHPHELVFKKASTVLVRPSPASWKVEDAEKTFPVQFDAVQQLQAELISPRQGVLEVGVEYKFQIRLSNHIKSVEVKGNQGGVILERSVPYVAPHGSSTSINVTTSGAFSPPHHRQKSLFKSFPTLSPTGATAVGITATNKLAEQQQQGGGGGIGGGGQCETSTTSFAVSQSAFSAHFHQQQHPMKPLLMGPNGINANIAAQSGSIAFTGTFKPKQEGQLMLWADEICCLRWDVDLREH